MLRAFQALLFHGANQQQALQRAVQARAQGLPPEQYGTPLPGTTHNTYHVTESSESGGWVKGAILTALLLGASGMGAWVLVRGTQAPQPSQAPAPPAVPPAAREGAWDALYEEQQPDGSWKLLKRERLKTKPE